MIFGRFSRWRVAWRWAVMGALSVLLVANSLVAEAQTTSGPGILFLHLKVTNQTVSLVEATLRPGVLKRVREADSTALFCELLAEDGTTLWKGNMPDPTLRHFEYEDPSNPGQLRRKSVQVSEAEFTLRVPSVPAARRIDFFKVPPGSPGAGLQKLSRTSWGSITLPVNQ
jgi:hypothetical protein